MHLCRFSLCCSGSEYIEREIARNFRSMKHIYAVEGCLNWSGWLSFVWLCIVCACSTNGLLSVNMGNSSFIINSKQNICLNARTNALLTERCLMCKLEIRLNAISGICANDDMEMFIPLENECQNESCPFGICIHINRQSGLQWFGYTDGCHWSTWNGKLKDTHTQRRGRRGGIKRVKRIPLILNEAFISSHHLVAHWIQNLSSIAFKLSVSSPEKKEVWNLCVSKCSD